MEYNASILHQELTAIGINISGCSGDGTVHISSRPACPEGEELTWVDPTDNLVALVLAAHEQALSSDEALALQQAVTEIQWANYIAARQAPVKQAREARYRAECDAMRLKLDDEFDIGSEEWLAGLAAWKLAKENIRAELPYEE